MTLYVVASRLTATNARLVHAFRRVGVEASLAPPDEARRLARPGDAVLGRVDVAADLAGVEPGIWELHQLRRRGVRLLNEPGALLATHDKLATALRLSIATLPHPATAHVDRADPIPRLRFPVVVKPRFGSWGHDVARCEDRESLVACLAALRSREWFRRHGALVQELVEPKGYDLRIVVAGGEVVGAIERVAAPGEWRTNIALGGTRRQASPPADACRLAVDAARAVGTDLVGVDLLPDSTGGWVVLELNGAVDFTSEYSLDGADVFEAAAGALVGARAPSLSLPRIARPQPAVALPAVV